MSSLSLYLKAISAGVGGGIAGIKYGVLETRSLYPVIPFCFMKMLGMIVLFAWNTFFHES